LVFQRPVSRPDTRLSWLPVVGQFRALATGIFLASHLIKQVPSATRLSDRTK
jgi:hypothetical protein